MCNKVNYSIKRMRNILDRVIDYIFIYGKDCDLVKKIGGLIAVQLGRVYRRGHRIPNDVVQLKQHLVHSGCVSNVSK